MTVGTFSTRIEIGTPGSDRFVSMEAIVDTGASYSMFPRRTLEQLGIRPIDQDEFTLADGRTVRRDVAVATVRLDGRVRPTICVVGEEGTKPLLGAITLEAFGLAADPVNRRLVKAPLYLL